jgi:hypothetical protein
MILESAEPHLPHDTLNEVNGLTLFVFFGWLFLRLKNWPVKFLTLPNRACKKNKKPRQRGRGLAAGTFLLP